ncbi:Fatty acid hydroxylase [Cavenderia fasciculata]|uniref:Fatty acid 2-hydroxylase n=1 Tax=Cavenderia fasciculata TaxID=261658 RepID=F4PN24_CACFS|nr:Fatty acid hydroxylase [Cavenderia fasciculata]EGG23714.1 Fatty acid hydroxylase [Cavenderia fasciculata]|eukprot:XP_004361565.1 Fatty acid hydroxylase [Cavenderia fasciculata]
MIENDNFSTTPTTINRKEKKNLLLDKKEEILEEEIQEEQQLQDVEVQLYSVSEIAKHDSVGDAWVSMDGNVYNVTDFMGDHPGGSEIVEPYLGKDISPVFLDERVHEHGDVAYNMLQRYFIGQVQGYRKTSPSVQEMIRSKQKLESICSDKNSTTPLVSMEELQSRIDVTKPMVPQLEKLDGENYMRWIHSQTGLKQIIIFNNSFLELFTRWPWWYIFVLWVPIITIKLYSSTQQSNSSYAFSFFIFSFGLFSWSFFEYLLHRFVFHIKTTSYWGNFFHFFIHGIHHLTPYDSTRLTFPPIFSAVIAVALWKGVNAFPTTLVENGFNQALYAGIACGYMLYDTIHYYFHHGEITWLPSKLKEFKTHHLNHHYKDDNKNFGITSTIFDIIFGTY